MFALYFLEVGLVLIVTPWSAFWDRNFFAEAVPFVSEVVRNNFMRGAVSGLGLLTAVAGFAELAGVMASRKAALDRDPPREPEEAGP